ncbi:hypothetical protein FRC03_009172 [Tulasnella sp. 419]|nr:hypothetical protein FRC03_009172 [Tulasnella sp. 419]
MASKNEKPAKKRSRTSTTDSDAKASTSKGKSKAKKVPVHRSRVVGRLADLMNMPVDVFAEICSHLFPIDLLHLAWSSKRLRSILMSKTARPIWRSSREHQLPTLPPCPDDLSDPQYIALLFSNICQACGSNRAQRTHFSLRTRHCASCYPKHVLTRKALLRGPCVVDLRGAVNLLNALPGDISSQGYAYNLVQLQKCLKEYRAINSDEGRAEYVATQEENKNKVKTHAKNVEGWHEEQSKFKAQQMGDIAQARWESIKKKLNELGWKEEDFPSMYSSQWTKLTRKHQALTDKVWKNLYPKLQPLLEARRTARLEREKADRRVQRRIRIEDLYQKYQKSKNQDDIFYPMAGRILAIPCIKDLLKDDVTGEITEARWEACIPQLEETLQEETKKLLQDVTSWYKRCLPITLQEDTADLENKKTKEAMSKDVEAPNMSLVTSVFKCGCCKEPVWLSTFFKHAHFKTRYEMDREGPEEGFISRSKGSGPGNLIYDQVLTEMVPKVLAAMKYDPLTATVQDVVIAPGIMYACNRCEDKHQEPVGFGDFLSHYQAELAWYESRNRPELGSHSLEPQGNRKNSSTRPISRILTEGDAEIMRSNYQAHLSLFGVKSCLPGYSNNDHWCSEYRAKSCNHCHYITSGTHAVGKMVHHLEAKHGIVVNLSELDAIWEEEDDFPPFFVSYGMYHMYNGLDLFGDEDYDYW